MHPQKRSEGPEREIRSLVGGLPRLGALVEAPIEAQRAAGYRDTLREICQQPWTWRTTGAIVAAQRERVADLVDESGVLDDPAGSVLLTGSGSSHYVGVCVAPFLQRAWGRHVRAVPSGDLLTQPEALLPGRGPCLVISVGRSGDSPESAAVVDALLARETVWQLLVTCNKDGRLARGYRGSDRIATVLLGEHTNDRSLVMTSSFTNMVLAGRRIPAARHVEEAAADPEPLAACGELVIRSSAEPLERVVTGRVGRVLFLGTGAIEGAALEAALKMLEMTAGRVCTMAESFLGVRHGPMAAMGSDTLVVCFLSSDPVHRAYEADLVRELDAKRVGGRRVLVGERVEPELVRRGDLVVDWAAAGRPDGADACVLHVLVGQWLAFWRCLAEGLHPDAPSASDIITRVVRPFTVHHAGAGPR